MNEKNNQYLHTPIAGVIVPFLQSVVTFFFVFVASWIFCEIALNLLDSWKYALVISAIALLVIWFARQSLWVGLIKIAERVTHTDINNDGVIEGEERHEPEQRVHITLTEVKDNGHVSPIKNFTLPASEDQLTDLAIGLLEEGKSFSEKEWSGPGKPFSLNQFRELRSELIKRGLLAQANEKDPRQGYALTAAGRALFRHYLPSLAPEPETAEIV
jgi:hypothetical protein